MKIKNNNAIIRQFNNRGVTLIELIVVIGILAILAVAGMAAINPVEQFKKANDSRRKADLSQIQKALETYHQDKGEYPSSTENYMISGTEWGKQWEPYMNYLPKDTNASKKYVYYSTGQSYYIYASLDRGIKDPQSCKEPLKANGECTNVPGTNLCGVGVLCNFGVSSPNVLP